MNLILSTQNNEVIAINDKKLSKPDHCENDYNHDIKVLTDLNKTLKDDIDLTNTVERYTDTIDSEEENKDGGNSTGANQRD